MQSTFVRLLFAVACPAALAAGAQAQVLTLDEAVRLGEAHSPRLAAQRAMIRSASEQLGRAAELPDPRLRLGIENLPLTGPDKFRTDRDFMTSRAVGFTQEFPNAAKREARNARAQQQHELERAGLLAGRTGVAREVALAWLDLHYAGRSRQALEALRRELETQAQVVSAAIARGRQGAAEGFAARGAHEAALERLIEQDRAVERARIQLASWLGEPAGRELGAPPDFARLPLPAHELLARLAEDPQLRLLDERERLARAEVDVARAAAKSDWMLEVGYGQRRPYFENMLTVMVGFDLQWQKERRQDRDVASRLAELEQARGLREEARRLREAELRGWLADHAAAARRIERFEQALLPLARSRSEAALAAYRGGRGELAAVLDAQRAAAETELGLVLALAERARAWASLAYVYPKEAP